MTRVRLGLAVFGILLLVGSAALYVIGGILVAPAPEALGTPPPSLSADSFQIHSASGSTLAAWAAKGSCECGVIVLLHGVRSNRRALIGRADMLHRVGYAVVLVDLQAHGESAGAHITFGHLERHDAIAAVAFARQQFPGQPIGVIGISLGGAAATLAGAPLAADALVLEAVYTDITTATKNRLARRLGGLSEVLTPLLLQQLPFRLGISPADLSPVEAIDNLRTPVLLIAGTEDEHTTPADSRKLYEAAGEQKEIWWVEGAAHIDFYAFQPEIYEQRVLSFFSKHL